MVEKCMEMVITYVHMYIFVCNIQILLAEL